MVSGVRAAFSQTISSARWRKVCPEFAEGAVCSSRLSLSVVVGLLHSFPGSVPCGKRTGDVVASR